MKNYQIIKEAIKEEEVLELYPNFPSLQFDIEFWLDDVDK